MQHATRNLIVPLLFSMVMVALAEADDTRWEPASGRLMSRWAKDVSPDNALPDYPRPQMARPDWLNLNGLWDYAIRPIDEARPEEFDGKLLVPFPVESALSGVMKRVDKENQLWYRRTVQVPVGWKEKRVLLHFGAVDWQTTVWVNGRRAGSHRGGYDPFSFDITNLLRDSTEQEIVLSVWDPTDEGTQPRGKQRRDPRGIWYTPTTGIWQTVWLEPVPQTAITTLKLVPDVDGKQLRLKTFTQGPHDDCLVHVVARDGKRVVSKMTGRPGQLIRLPIAAPKLWSPDSPFLYDLAVSLIRKGKTIDTVDSYFGMRKIALGKDKRGVPMMMLNDEPLFQFGPLDQGFWPDGLYTAPTDEALKYDIEVTKRLGFNMARKHVKVEPARWYMWCDRLGLLVWQDLPNGDKHAKWPHDGLEITRSEASAAQYRTELKAMIDAFGNHPSIVMWVPFNEAWGQFDTVAITKWTKQYDPTRLVNSASGGNDFPTGDVHDIHRYPGPDCPPAENYRAAILGEYGGLGLPIKGHTLLEEKNWGYRSFTNREDLTKAYLELLDKMRPMIDSHLAAALYTQTTDVEIEINGLMTYDRAIIKMDPRTISEANRRLYLPPRPVDRRTAALRSTVAYWRFEDGKAGAPVGNVQDSPKAIGVADASGHDNPLYAFAAANAPTFSGNVANKKVPLLGEPNRLCLDDTQAGGNNAPTRDLFTDPARIWTKVNTNTFQFLEWTIEASLNIAEPGRIHGIVGKDGQSNGRADAPLQLTVRKDNRVEIAAIDGRGKLRRAVGRAPLAVGRWYHVAAVCDGNTLTLLINSDDEFTTEDTSPFDGPLWTSTGTWTVGRGWANGHITNDARALIDEVRISAVALPRTQLLFSKQAE